MFNNKIIANNNVFVVVINSNNKKTNNNRLQHLSLDDGQCFFNKYSPPSSAYANAKDGKVMTQ